MTDKISIITATFNSEKYIENTYLSLKSQSYENWEWIVTDDCSTDSTLSKLSVIANLDNRVKIHKLNVNSGAAVARNYSMSKAKGVYVAFIDSDDLWSKTKLEQQIAFMKENSHSFTFTSYQIVSEAGIPTGKIVDLETPCETDYKGLLNKKVTLGCSTVILEKWIIDKHKMTDIRSGQDYLLWLDILGKTVPKAFKLSEALTSYRITPGSVSRNKIKKSLRQWQIYREYQELGFIESLLYFTSYAFRAVFRK